MGGVNHTPSPAYQDWLSSHKPFHWFIAFYGILKNGGFDVIIGNPPYVVYSKVKKDYIIRNYGTENCGNLYAYVFERSLQFLHPNGWKSMIIPVAGFSTDQMSSLQDSFHHYMRTGWIQTYHIRPAKLFSGAEQRLAIYTLQRNSRSSQKLYTSRYHRWHEKFRPHLFAITEHTDVSRATFQNSVPKLHCEVEKSLWKKLVQFSVLGNYIMPSPTSYTAYFHDAPGYWIRAMDFVPYFWTERNGQGRSTHVKPLHLKTGLNVSVITGALNSSLFFWWFAILSNCRDLVSREIRNFPIGIDEMAASIKRQLSELSIDLMLDLRHHSKRKKRNQKTGVVHYDEFYPSHSKSIIDKIDCVLAQHYGFTDEELDFIINYDIKYRMGLGN